jgi:hypothetical protein
MVTEGVPGVELRPTPSVLLVAESDDVESGGSVVWPPPDDVVADVAGAVEQGGHSKTHEIGVSVTVSV